MTEKMRCQYCMQEKNWIDGFPSSIEAICWRCSWAKHMRDTHKGAVRKARREARKKVKDRLLGVDRKLIEAETTERLVLAGYIPAEPTKH